ncbi:hypothetical protein AJ79_03595 [Helicocarpus griseus UAMH5409]|uniref:Dienelactone hydrolase domain-containing protein n=1 Tax=Helicocarpus griseus UAMH5409 TaxID=1447875 RepID=A0A2B7XYA1_9EURO|nr:hypothetical protein AJ79_03595 [Helicocarpus griseus UAMH5409]
MASNPPGPCCLMGFKHEGTPKGEMKKIGNISTYFTDRSDAKNTDKAIIYLSDIFGISHNGKLLADKFAEQGYFTVYPDLLHGDHVASPEDYHSGKVDMVDWTSRHGPETVDPIIQSTIDYLRNTVCIQKIAAVGYCFGGKYVARFLMDGKIDSGYTAHPSFITEEELAAIQKPLSIVAAEDDTIFPREKRIESESILVKTKQRFQINLISGVQHGFAVRADLSAPGSRFAMEAAFVQAVMWFHYTL